MKAFAILFVASLLVTPLAARAASSPAPAPTPAPANAAFLGQIGTPAPIFLTGCTASTLCPCIGGISFPISCMGTTSCTVVEHNGRLAVDCDGNFTNCPGLLNC